MQVAPHYTVEYNSSYMGLYATVRVGESRYGTSSVSVNFISVHYPCFGFGRITISGIEEARLVRYQISENLRDLPFVRANLRHGFLL